MDKDRYSTSDHLIVTPNCWSRSVCCSMTGRSLFNCCLVKPVESFDSIGSSDLSVVLSLDSVL